MLRYGTYEKNWKEFPDLRWPAMRATFSHLKLRLTCSLWYEPNQCRRRPRPF